MAAFLLRSSLNLSMNKDDNKTWCWLSALSGIDPTSSPIITYKEHNYKTVHLFISGKCRYLTNSCLDGTFDSNFLCDTLLAMIKDNQDECKFSTHDLSQMVIGKISASRAVDRAIRTFFDNFGYIPIEVQTVQQSFRSSGDVKIAVLVSDAKIFQK